MKRLCRDGIVCNIPRTKDQCYCYAIKGYNPRNQKNEHQLKIVDAFIKLGMPKDCLIEHELGAYEPDLFFKDHFNRSVCVEVQLTHISKKRMQEKINNFMKEEGKNHDAKLLYIFSDHDYTACTYDQTKYKIRFEAMPKEKTL
jgi:hypothetical protein